jgi:hypothetical protein
LIAELGHFALALALILALAQTILPLLGAEVRDGRMMAAGAPLALGHCLALAAAFGLLLNADARLMPGVLEVLCAAAQRYPDAGLLAPEIFGDDGALQFGHALPHTPAHKRYLPMPAGDCCMDYVGGSAMLMGPIVGGAFVALLPFFLEKLADFSFILKGVVLIAVLMFAPAGVCDVLARPVRAWRRRQLRRAGAGNGDPSKPDAKAVPLSGPKV